MLPRWCVRATELVNTGAPYIIGTARLHFVHACMQGSKTPSASVTPTAPQDTLGKSFSSGSKAEVYQLTDDMLASLGDPFTRLMPPESDEEEQFNAELDGKVGLGLWPGAVLVSQGLVWCEV